MWNAISHVCTAECWSVHVTSYIIHNQLDRIPSNIMFWNLMSYRNWDELNKLHKDDIQLRTNRVNRFVSSSAAEQQVLESWDLLAPWQHDLLLHWAIYGLSQISYGILGGQRTCCCSRKPYCSTKRSKSLPGQLGAACALEYPACARQELPISVDFVYFWISI